MWNKEFRKSENPLKNNLNGSLVFIKKKANNIEHGDISGRMNMSFVNNLPWKSRKPYKTQERV